MGQEESPRVVELEHANIAVAKKIDDGSLLIIFGISLDKTMVEGHMRVFLNMHHTQVNQRIRYTKKCQSALWTKATVLLRITNSATNALFTAGTTAIEDGCQGGNIG